MGVTLTILSTALAGPHERVAGLEGFDTVTHAGPVVLESSTMLFSEEEGYSGRGHSPAI